MLKSVFCSLLLTSAVGAAAALLLMALRPVTRRHFSSGWHYYLWLVVLVAMMLPLRLPLPAHVQPVASHAVEQVIVLPQAETRVPLRVEHAAETPQETTTDWLAMASHVWLTGATLLFAGKLLRYALFWRRVHRNTRPCACPQTAAFTRRSVRVRTGAAVGSPQLVGLFRPTLLLPETSLSAEQMAHVLSHEMTHLKRYDLLYKWFAFLVKCVHWFNPVVYLVNRQIRLDGEISCDQAVVREMDAPARERYIHTILALLSGETACGDTFATEMVGNLRFLKRRFRMIQNKPKISKKARWASVGAAVVLAAVSLLVSGVLGGSAPMNTQAQTAPAPVLQTQKPTATTTTAATTSATATTTTVADATAPVATTTATTVTTVESDWCWPCPRNDQITSSFGYRWGKKHAGIDILARVGDPVVAAADGTVVEVNPSGWGGGYGVYVLLDHGNGLTTMYGCLDSPNVTVGQAVARGQVIGYAGNTGDSSGPHLHFEVRVDGVALDPTEYL